MGAPPLEPQAFPVTSRWTYLDHAGINPLSDRVVAEMTREMRLDALEGAAAFDEHLDHADRVRAAAARLVGAAAGTISFVKNTTEGLSFVAGGLDWSEGDRVVVPNFEFPSTIYPWLALRDRGVVVDLVEPTGPGRALAVESFAEAIARGAPPKVVVTSWVQFGRGYRSDLAGLALLAHDVGALLCVDAIQGLGAIPAEFEEWGVDFASAGAHKWLLGPLGIGIFYTSQQARPRLRSLEPGWSSVVHRMEWDNLELDLDTSARRFEGGTQNMAGLYGLGAALAMLEAAGIEQVWAHISALTDRLCARAERLGGEVLSDRTQRHRSGIVTVAFGDADHEALAEKLKAERVACSPRMGGIRFSPHGYNTPEEIDRALDALAALL